MVFPVKFAKILRTSIAKNIYKRLPLFTSPQNNIANSSSEFGLNKTLSEYKVIFKHNNFVRSNAIIAKKHLLFQLILLLKF